MFIRKSISCIALVLVAVFLSSCSVHKENYLAAENPQKVDPVTIGTWKMVAEDGLYFFEVTKSKQEKKLEISFWRYESVKRHPSSGKISLGIIQQYNFEGHSVIVAYIDDKFQGNGIVQKIDPQWIYLRINEDGRYCEFLDFKEEEKIEGLRKALEKKEDPKLPFEKTNSQKPTPRESNLMRLSGLKRKVEENEKELKRW